MKWGWRTTNLAQPSAPLSDTLPRTPRPASSSPAIRQCRRALPRDPEQLPVHITHCPADRTLCSCSCTPPPYIIINHVSQRPYSRAARWLWLARRHRPCSLEFNHHRPPRHWGQREAALLRRQRVQHRRAVLPRLMGAALCRPAVSSLHFTCPIPIHHISVCAQRADNSVGI